MRVRSSRRNKNGKKHTLLSLWDSQGLGIIPLIFFFIEGQRFPICWLTPPMSTKTRAVWDAASQALSPSVLCGWRDSNRWTTGVQLQEVRKGPELELSSMYYGVWCGSLSSQKLSPQGWSLSSQKLNSRVFEEEKTSPCGHMDREKESLCQAGKSLW